MVVTMSACTHAGSPTTTAVATPSAASRAPKGAARDVVRLVALPAESAAFPNVARAATDSLSHAQVAGLGTAQVSKVSLEVVQISIECVDSSAACYQAVGRSLTANGLLFAQIAAMKRPQLKVTVTLFDVDARSSRTKAEKVFESEDEATAGIPELVAEATRP